MRVCYSVKTDTCVNMYISNSKLSGTHRYRVFAQWVISKEPKLLPLTLPPSTITL